MKAISAAIVVLAGAIVFAAGAIVQHNDTQIFVCSVGGVLGLVGLYSWYTSFRRNDS